MYYLSFLSLLLLTFQSVASLCEEVAFSELLDIRRHGETVGLRNSKTESETDQPQLSYLKIALEERIKYSFQNQSLKRQVFSRTFLKRGTKEGERLEFLGDSIFNMIILDIFLTRYPPEYAINRVHTALIANQFQAQMALFLHLDEYLTLLPRPWNSSLRHHSISKRTKIKILADVLESLVGAMYVDGGYSVAKHLIEESLNFMIKEHVISRYVNKFKRLEMLFTKKPISINGEIKTLSPFSIPTQPLEYRNIQVLGYTVLKMITADFLIRWYPLFSVGQLATKRDSFQDFIKSELLKRNLEEQISEWYEIAWDSEKWPSPSLSSFDKSYLFLGFTYLMEGEIAVRNTVEEYLSQWFKLVSALN